MVFRAAKGDQESPRGPRGGLKRLGRGSLEVPGELLEVHKLPQATILDTFIGFRVSKIPPGGPQVTIYRTCRRFRASRRGTGPLKFGLSRARLAPRTIIMIVVRGTGPLKFRLSRTRSDPRTRSRTRFLYLYILVSNLNADAPSSPEGRRISLHQVITPALRVRGQIPQRWRGAVTRRKKHAALCRL